MTVSISVRTVTDLVRKLRLEGDYRRTKVLCDDSEENKEKGKRKKKFSESTLLNFVIEQ